MNKSLKKILVAGASLLMMTSFGAGIHNIHAMSKYGHYVNITTRKEYKEVKHAKGVPYTNVGPRRIKHLKAWGDNDTIGYVYGHKVLFGKYGGIILKIDGHRPSYRKAKAVFHENIRHHTRRHHRKHVVRHHQLKRKIERKSQKHIRKHRFSRKRIRHNVSKLRHRGYKHKNIHKRSNFSYWNSKMNNPDWYINNAQRVNKELEKIDEYNDMSSASNYIGVRDNIGDSGFNSYNIRHDPIDYHLGFVIGALYGNDPYSGTHPIHSLSPRTLKAHKKDIIQAINDWKAVAQLVKKYPDGNLFSVGRNIAGQEQASCLPRVGSKTVYYINGHKMTNNDKNKIRQAIENKNAYDDPDEILFDPYD